MLYSNVNLSKSERTMDWGTLHQFEIGESGRGRHLMCIPCPPDMESIDSGIHKDLSISFTRSGRPRIVRKSDDKLYAILSSKGGYTRRGDGRVWIPNSDIEKFKVLARGNGADGAAGRIGSWDCVLLECPLTNAVIRVRTSGGGYGTPAQFYFLCDGTVYHCDNDTISDFCDVHGLSLPAGITFEENGSCIFDQDLWSQI